MLMKLMEIWNRILIFYFNNVIDYILSINRKKNDLLS